jgi:hypothetical protein
LACLSFPQFRGAFPHLTVGEIGAPPVDMALTQ